MFVRHKLSSGIKQGTPKRQGLQMFPFEKRKKVFQKDMYKTI